LENANVISHIYAPLSIGRQLGHHTPSWIWQKNLLWNTSNWNISFSAILKTAAILKTCETCQFCKLLNLSFLYKIYFLNLNSEPAVKFIFHTGKVGAPHWGYFSIYFVSTNFYTILFLATFRPYRGLWGTNLVRRTIMLRRNKGKKHIFSSNDYILFTRPYSSSANRQVKVMKIIRVATLPIFIQGAAQLRNKWPWVKFKMAY
jgi:hypothetical protein